MTERLLWGSWARVSMFSLDPSPFAVSTKTRTSSRLPSWLGRKTGADRHGSRGLRHSLSSHSHKLWSLAVSISPQSLRNAAHALLPNDWGLMKFTGEMSLQDCKGLGWRWYLELLRLLSPSHLHFHYRCQLIYSVLPALSVWAAWLYCDFLTWSVCVQM